MIRRNQYLAAMLLSGLIFSGCATQLQRPAIEKSISQNQSIAVIEQVLFEQYEKHRPQTVFITDEFIGLGYGMKTTSRSAGVVLFPNSNLLVGLGTTKSLSKDINERIYFNSVSEIRLYSKSDYFVIQVWTDRVYKNIYTFNKAKANQFIDAIEFFKRQSENSK